MSWTSPYDGDIIYGIGHQHIGALNISLYIDNDLKCTNVPKYGTQPGIAGNEKGYVVAIPPCEFKNNKLHVKKGQKLTVTSLYNVDPNDDRGIGPGGSHGGVMSLFYLGIANLKKNRR